MGWSVIGHQRVVDDLRRSLELGVTAHACLFAGPRGIGKMEIALHLAQALNCAAPAAERPCRVCRSCQRIRQAKHADVHTIGLSTGERQGENRRDIRIEQIKEMQQAADLRPFEGACRVFIIDGAEHLNQDAANRLLKTLEEPAAGVYIILLATDLPRILPTIVSRCRTYELRGVPDRLIDAALQAQGQDPEQAQRLARWSEGRIGWALRAAADPSLAEARSAALEQAIALSSQPLHERLRGAGDLAAAFARDRDALHQWLGLLAQWWRDLLLVKAGHPGLVTNLDQKGILEAMVASLSLQDIAVVITCVRDAAAQLQSNANPHLALDVLMCHVPVAQPAKAALAERAF